MFRSLWHRFSPWQLVAGSGSRRPSRPPHRAIPRLEALEDRLAPANFAATISILNGVPTLTLTKNGPGGTFNGTSSELVITEPAFGFLNVSSQNGGDSITFQGATSGSFTTPVQVIGLVVNLGAAGAANGFDNLLFAGGGNNPDIELTSLKITGAAGAKTLTATDLIMLINAKTKPNNNVNINFTAVNNGGNNATFTDCNVFTPATISGFSTFTINVSNANPTATNFWNSLTVNNAAGGDTTHIFDTDFSGNVAINNGNGGTAQTTTLFSDDQSGFNTALLNASGNIAVSTTKGPSNTRVIDYNVNGTVNVTTGTGSKGLQNYVGIEDGATTTGNIPLIQNVVVNGSAPTNSNLVVNMGTNVGGSFPLNVGGTITINSNGKGAVNVRMNDLTVKGATTMTFNQSTSSATVTMQSDETFNTATTYGGITINGFSTGTNTYSFQTIAGVFDDNGPLNVNTGTGIDNITMGALSAAVDITGNFGVSSTAGVSGTKTIQVIGGNNNNQLPSTKLGGVNFNNKCNGSIFTTFTDTDVSGPATLIHSNSSPKYQTNFTLNVSNNNLNLLNVWNSLTITNSNGQDNNIITDTDFTGSVNINNGNGDGTTSDVTKTILSSKLFTTGLLSIQGGLSISSKTGPVDSEAYDYNIHGSVTLNGGNGINNQGPNSILGLEDNQTTAGTGVPVIGGTVTITGSGVPGAVPLDVYVGISQSLVNDYPITFNSGLNITMTGGNSSNIWLNDITADNGTVNIMYAASTHDNSIFMQSSTITETWNIFNLTSNASGVNNFFFQGQKGTLDFSGQVTVKATKGANNLFLAADAGGAVAGAAVDFFDNPTTVAQLSMFKATSTGPNTPVVGAIFFYVAPTIAW
jgi:hypothetical protein